MFNNFLSQVQQKNWFRKIYDWVLSFANSPYAIFALICFSFTESSFFPIPPDVLLIAMCIVNPRRSFQYALVCSISSIAGGFFGYGIGYFAWEYIHEFFFEYIPGFSAEKFEVVKSLYNEYGVAIVFTAGFSPIPYKLFTIVSGVMSLDIVKFFLASFVGRSLRFFLVAWLIYRFGEKVRGLIDRYFNIFAIGFSILFIGGILLVKWGL